MDWRKIEEEATAELDREEHRQAIDRAKERIIRARSAPWWHKLIPFTVTIRKR